MTALFVGRFVLGRSLGSGGMGRVHLARDLARGSECALKLLDGNASPEVAALLRREFQALAHVRHPAIVDVYELGFAPDGRPFLVTEYVPGFPADEALDPRDLGPLLWCMARVADGLEALHAGGVVHGDIKPANILVVPGAASGEPVDVRLVDFGLSTVLGEMPGTRGGTPGFSAPEIGRGSPADPSADLYALGATLYALLTGSAAFAPSTTSRRVLEPGEHAPDAAPLHVAGVPRDLASLVLRLMSPRPEDRPAHAREVRRELESLHPKARQPLADRLRAATCVGRERELGLLRAEAARADLGARIVLVSGREGSGKSTLLTQAAARLRIEGRAVHTLSPHDGLSPWTSLAAQTQVDDPGPEDVASIAQRLAAPVEGAGAPVILIDDADRYSAVERRWLRRLLLHDPSPRALWLLAMRKPTGDAELLTTAGFARAVPLEPLGVAVVTRLAAVRLGETPPDTMGERLVARTGGWPGAIVHALRRAAEQGAIRDTPNGVIVDVERLDETLERDESLPERLASLEVPARHAALVLEACGGVADAAALAACGVTLEGATAAALEESGLARLEDGRWRLANAGAAGGLLDAAPAAEARLAATSVLQRPGLPAALRFALHARLGESDAAHDDAEEAFARAPTRAFAERVARWFANDAARAATWWRRAGEQARAAGRYDRAEVAFRSALAVASGGAEREAAHEGLVVSLLRNGRLDDMAVAVEAALAEPLGDAPRARIIANDAARLQRLQRLDAARARAGEAVTLAERARDGAAVALARLILSSIEHWSGRHDAAVHEAQSSIAAAHAAADPLGEARAQVTLAFALRERGDRERAEALLVQHLDSWRSGRMVLAVEEALLALAPLRMERGDWSGARKAYEEALRLALQDDRRSSVALCMAALAVADALAGRLAVARRGARAAWWLCARHLPALRGEVARAHAIVHHGRGDFRRAERWARQAVRLSIGRWPVEWERLARWELARVLLMRGRTDEALAAATLAAPAEANSQGGLLLAMTAAAAHLANGSTEDATSLAGECRAALAGSAWVYGHAHLDLLDARLALARGEGTLARASGERAIERFRALPAPADAARAALALAEDALQRGLETALRLEDLLDQAIERFEALGDAGSRARALRALVEGLRRGAQRGGGGLEATYLLKQIRSLLGSMSNVEEVSKRALEMAARHFRAERGVLLLRAEDSEQLNEVAHVGRMDANTLRSAHGYSRRVVDRVQESRVSVVIDDASAHLEWASQSILDMGVHRVACAPLLVGHRCVGALYLDSRQVAGAFDEHDRHALDELARLLGVAIQGARAQVEVQHQVEELSDENRSLRRALSRTRLIDGFVADCPAMQEVLGQIETAARNDLTVLLSGESGTGKEKLARQIHLQSRRKKGPFLTLNCGAVPSELLAAELFGILEGIATGVKHRRGKFELADGGTLFLDEIADMPLAQQVALLRVLQTREVTPVGGHRPVVVDVRIVAASNRLLTEMVESKQFRQDLYYRLAVFPVHVPPLRERKQDIPAMVHQFVASAVKQLHLSSTPRLSKDFLPTVIESDWVGNVRELQNYIERIVAMCDDGILRPHPLPADLQASPAGAPGRASRLRPLADAVRELEERLIRQALQVTNGNQVRAANKLEITEQSLRYRLRKYGLARGNTDPSQE